MTKLRLKRKVRAILLAECELLPVQNSSIKPDAQREYTADAVRAAARPTRKNLATLRRWLDGGLYDDDWFVVASATSDYDDAEIFVGAAIKAARIEEDIQADALSLGIWIPADGDDAEYAAAFAAAGGVEYL